MSSIETLSRQPNFPNEDLTDMNAEIIDYYLRDIRGERAYAEYLQKSMRALHTTAHEALRICGVQVDYSQDEYESFCGGFASFEYASLLVNPRIVSGSVAVRNTQEILIKPGDLVEFEIADRRETWMQAFPNTYGIITDNGARRGETIKQLQARATGAQLACELEMVA